MERSYEKLLLIGSLLLLVSILASKTSGRLGVPVLVVFLGVGMLAGPGGMALVPSYAPEAAQGLGAVSLAIILFSGGLEKPNGKAYDPYWPGGSVCLRLELA